MRRSVPAGVAGLLLVAIAGCAPLGGSGFRVLDRAPTEEDALPAAFLDQEDTYFEAETARLAGEHDGNRVWLSRGADGDSICIIVDYADSDHDSSACGGPSGGTSVESVAGPEYRIVPDEYGDQTLPNVVALD